MSIGSRRATQQPVVNGSTIPESAFTSLPRVAITKKFLVSATAAMLAFSGATRAAETAGNYATSLGNVYGGYIRIAALKDACDTAVPATRSSSAKAYSGWEAQNRALLRDLQQRVQAMIRASSRDKDEYVRNIGKYEGDILLQRREYRDTVLRLGKDELREQCERLPEMLNGPGADLAKVYAADIKVIRARKY
jgi:hypothetical protein